MEKAGIFELIGEHTFIGQHWDEKALFEASVVDGDLVYKHSSGEYRKAIADGSEASVVAGIADVTRGQVYSSGFISKTMSHPASTKLYLSASNAGSITSQHTGYEIGHMLDNDTFVLRVVPKSHVPSKADAVVSDLEGYKHYSSLQTAIDEMPEGSWIRVDKVEEVRGTTPVTLNKRINIDFLVLIQVLLNSWE